jgi:hypothetical protein
LILKNQCTLCQHYPIEESYEPFIEFTNQLELLIQGKYYRGAEGQLTKFAIFESNEKIYLKDYRNNRDYLFAMLW